MTIVFSSCEEFEQDGVNRFACCEGIGFKRSQAESTNPESGFIRGASRDREEANRVIGIAAGETFREVSADATTRAKRLISEFVQRAIIGENPTKKGLHRCEKRMVENRKGPALD